MTRGEASCVAADGGAAGAPGGVQPSGVRPAEPAGAPEPAEPGVPARGQTGGKTRALVMFVAAVVIWGSVGLFVRAIQMPSGVIALARGVIGVVFLLVVLGVQALRSKRAATKCAAAAGTGGQDASPRKLNTRELPLMVLTGVAIGVNWVLLFEAYRFTTVAVATLCYYFAPLLVILVSPLVLKERLIAKKLCCVAVALVGVVLVSGVVAPGAGSVGGATAFSGAGVACGLGAALFYAVNMVLNKLTPQTDPVVKTIVQLGCAALTMIPYLLVTDGFAGLTVTGQGLAALAILGVVHTGLAYLLYFAAIRALPAQTIAVLSYLDPATAIVLSAVFLAEPLTGLGLLGSVLILGSALASER